ncbi:MAG: hypothetical protein R3F59_11075 [Myxococcota bacterium]
MQRELAVAAHRALDPREQRVADGLGGLEAARRPAHRRQVGREARHHQRCHEPEQRRRGEAEPAEAAGHAQRLRQQVRDDGQGLADRREVVGEGREQRRTAHGLAIRERRARHRVAGAQPQRVHRVGGAPDQRPIGAVLRQGHQRRPHRHRQRPVRR